jgi:hypothetical protein
MANKITVNGREYASPKEMPADVRRTYERAMAELAKGSDAVRVTDTRIVFNGVEYGSPEVLPAPMRAILERTTGVLAKRLERSIREALPGTTAEADEPAAARITVSSTAPESTTGRFLIAGLIALAAFLVWYFLR